MKPHEWRAYLYSAVSGCPSDEDLYRFRSQGRTDADIEAHVLRCPRCQEVLSDVVAFVEAPAAGTSSYPYDEDLRQVLRRVELPTEQPTTLRRKTSGWPTSAWAAAALLILATGVPTAVALRLKSELDLARRQRAPGVEQARTAPPAEATQPQISSAIIDLHPVSFTVRSADPGARRPRIAADRRVTVVLNDVDTTADLQLRDASERLVWQAPPAGRNAVLTFPAGFLKPGFYKVVNGRRAYAFQAD